MVFLRDAGVDVTNDPALIDAVSIGPPGEASDPSGPGAPFTVTKHPSGFQLDWSSPFRGDPAQSYTLYHVPLAGLAAGAAPECDGTLGGASPAVRATLPEDAVLLVVARNAAGEGSLGRDSRGRDRRGPDPAFPCP
jgi:hypothetical protein